MYFDNKVYDWMDGFPYPQLRLGYCLFLGEILARYRVIMCELSFPHSSPLLPMLANRSNISL